MQSTLSCNGNLHVAIIMDGNGRWGRSLVRSVQGKSDEIEFILAYTRTPATAKMPKIVAFSNWLLAEAAGDARHLQELTSEEIDKRQSRIG